MPRSPGLMMFVLTTDKTNYFNACACALMVDPQGIYMYVPGVHSTLLPLTKPDDRAFITNTST
jgi:hypothetical protein